MKKTYLICIGCGQICAPRKHIPYKCRECGAKQPWTFTDDKAEAVGIKENILKEIEYENRKRTRRAL